INGYNLKFLTSPRHRAIIVDDPRARVDEEEHDQFSLHFAETLLKSGNPESRCFFYSEPADMLKLHQKKGPKTWMTRDPASWLNKLFLKLGFPQAPLALAVMALQI